MAKRRASETLPVTSTPGTATTLSLQRRKRQRVDETVSALTADVPANGEGVTGQTVSATTTTQATSSRPSRPPTVTRMEYTPTKQLNVDKLLAGGRCEATVFVTVAPTHLSRKHNPNVCSRRVWGTDVYTDDSDVVAMLAHTGSLVLNDDIVPSHRFDHLCVRLRVVRHESGVSPPFIASEAYGLRSRAWGTHYRGGRVSIQSVTAVKGDKECVLDRPVLARELPHIPNLHRWGETSDGLATDTAVTFGLLNEPCLCYTITAVTDTGDDPALFPSTRIKQEALYLEDATSRYELTVVNDQEATDDEDPLLRFARVQPDTMNTLLIARSVASLPEQRHQHRCRRKSAAHAPPDCTLAHKLAKLSVPLAPDAVHTLHTVRWSDLEWAPRGVSIAGTFYAVTKLCFSQRTRPRPMTAAAAPARAEPS